MKIIIEGSATKLIPELIKEESPMFKLCQKAKEEDLFEGVCRACSGKMNILKSAKNEGLPILDDMSGHPGMRGGKR